METDPIAIDLNVDAALLLRDMAGIDSYPPILALMPNIFDVDDLERVRAVVAEQLTEVGIIDGDRVHPTVEHWLQCLDRPDVELMALVLATGLDGEQKGMLRMSLVRRGDTHVLAVRCDDEIVIQAVYQQEQQLDSVWAAVGAALGSTPALSFAPVTVAQAELAEIPGDQDGRRQALLELGAQPHTAGVLGRALDEVVRRAEVTVVQHQDGVELKPKYGVSVLDTLSGRIVVTPSVAMDGEVRSTYTPGDDAALHAAIVGLVELLPGRSWFDTSRIG
ncbi:ESX secretion-associated protein EspG [Nocardia sp. NPDC051990]|uniref:ESX secretion-associated protein EspG n=1 Tax=Nocardia sp. NPDC051990 TaxID=3155285 RepID=UPI003435263F